MIACPLFQLIAGDAAASDIGPQHVSDRKGLFNLE
jgi:hypothetical protein